MESALVIGLGMGLASVAGVRAFAPLFLAALFGALGVFDLPTFYAGFVGNEWTLVAVLGALAAIEVVLDKVRSLEPYFNYAMIPLRAASGAVLFSVAQGLGIVAEAVPWLVAGAVVAGAVAALKAVLRPSSGGSAAGVSGGFLSLIEDAVALVGGAVGLFVPILPLLLVVFLLFFFHRIRRRRGRKFGGLRILGD